MNFMEIIARNPPMILWHIALGKDKLNEAKMNNSL